MKKKNRDQGSGWLGRLSKFMGLDEEDDYEYYDEEESEQEETGREAKTGRQFYKEPGRRGKSGPGKSGRKRRMILKRRRTSVPG